MDNMSNKFNNEHYFNKCYFNGNNILFYLLSTTWLYSLVLDIYIQISRCYQLINKWEIRIITKTLNNKPRSLKTKVWMQCFEVHGANRNLGTTLYCGICLPRSAGALKKLPKAWRIHNVICIYFSFIIVIIELEPLVRCIECFSGLF